RGRRPEDRKGVTRLALLLAATAVLAAACGSSTPKDDPAEFASKVVGLIVHNKYSTVWEDLHPVDQKGAPFSEYVSCETRNPVIAVPRSVKVVSVNDESVGLGDGKFLESKAVDVRLGFDGGVRGRHTVHAGADPWKW